MKSGSSGDEGHFPPRNGQSNCREFLLYQLSYRAGFDISMLAFEDTVVRFVVLRAKLSDCASFEDVALTTDPSLQYLTQKQREQLVKAESDGVEEGTKIEASENAMVSKYWAWRDQLGANDPLAHCKRFVVGLTFDKKTDKVALQEYF